MLNGPPGCTWSMTVQPAPGFVFTEKSRNAATDEYVAPFGAHDGCTLHRRRVRHEQRRNVEHGGWMDL
eukprot:3944515-Prymnesium_polylepis.1